MGNLVKETPYSEMNATIEVFDRLGVTREHFARLRTDVSYAERISSYMLCGGIDGSVHQKLARALMDHQNFFGIEEWSTFHGISFTKKQLREVAEFPWGEDVLNAPCPWNTGKLIRETHTAFLGLSKFKGEPLTILKWHDICTATGQPKFDFNQNPWYKENVFAKDATCQFRWHLMLREIMPNSTKKKVADQPGMLPAEYEIPTAISEVTKNLLYYRKNNVWLNPARWARTAEMASRGRFSCVGSFERELSVSYWIGDPRYFVGVGASRKLPS